MAKLATEFLENTAPVPSGGFLIFDPVTGLRERLTIGQFFSRFGINVGVNNVNIPILTGDIEIIGTVTATNLSGTNTGDQDISGIAVNAGDINTLEINQGTQAGQISTIQAEQTVQDSDISLNAGKINVIEGEQVIQDNAIALNTLKRSYPLTDEQRLANTSGTNTGDQNISGITTNANDIILIQDEQVVQDSAIALNTAKDGITSAQSADIIVNNAKISFDSTSSTRLANTSGTNTGNQDLSGYLLNTTDTLTGALTVQMR
jgi:hypothetical protein